MDYRLTITQRPSFLHASVVGPNTPQNVLRFLEQAYAACVERGQGALLLEMNLSGPSIGSANIFNVIAQRSADGAKLRKIAYVDRIERDPEKVRFAETVAVNRGVNVRVFPDIEAAGRWLVEDAPSR
jgi:hypothetical protein